MKLCLQCQPNKNKSSKLQNITGTAKWIQDNPNLHGLPPNRKPPSHKVFSPINSTVKIQVKVPMKEGKVLFWGAKARGVYNNRVKAIDAYIKDRRNNNYNYVNTGIGKIKNHVLTIKCQAPRPYYEKGIFWTPHVHFVCAKNNKEWNKKSYTIPAVPFHTNKYKMTCIKQSNRCSFMTPKQVYTLWDRFIKINSLPIEYRGIEKKGKPGLALHIPYTTRLGVIKKFAKKIKNKAVLLYCYDKSCRAASDLIQKLLQVGIVNIYYMPSGIKGWYAKYK